ncbi:MAG: radical SAM family heme chaperone HemW [Prevotella sp.]|nr:radical SAM family heme chaperone HemW [Prevotella sp.]
MAGLYIHIPFCKSRCIYCGFYSTTHLSLRDSYVSALCHEMEMRSRNVLFQQLSTIYIGGGTPSQLSISHLHDIFKCIDNHFHVDDDAEITIECNPDDVTPSFAEALIELPINRVSMGVQTFNDERLKFLRRRHSSEQVLEAIERLRKVGIGNISIDLMFGFPNETLEEWESDIEQALNLHVEHISAYSLMYEEGTPLYNIRSKQIENGLVNQDEEDELSVKMYELLMEKLEKAGFEHYEISNFALKKEHGSYRSRHNSSYWQGIPYLGIGAAAHSYDIDSRQWNVADIQQYIQVIQRGEIPAEREFLTDDLRYNDLVTTAMRTREGIALNQLKDKYKDYLLKQAQNHITYGLLTLIDKSIALTKKGLFVSDSVMSDLMLV